jgi:hypothetical protein
VDEGPVSLELDNYVKSVLGVPLEDYSLKYDPANNTFVKS